MTQRHKSYPDKSLYCVAAEQAYYPFDAFVSYSGKKQEAQHISRRISRLRRRFWEWSSLKIYLDQRGIGTGSYIGDELKNAIDSSRYFILLASPCAAASPWVQQEVSQWLAHRSVSRILILVSDGTIGWNEDKRRFSPDTDCLPASLHSAFKSMPRWELLGPPLGSSGRRARFKAQRSSIIAVGSRILGIERDQLAALERSRVRRQVGVVLLLVLLLGAAFFAAARGWTRIWGLPATEAYQEGRTMLNQRQTSADVENALVAFRRALDLSPTHKDALLGLAEALTLRIGYGASTDPARDLADARSALDTAERNGANDALFYYTSARLFEYYEWDLVAAQESYREALRNEPEHIDALHGIAGVCTFLGRHEEAIEWSQKAKRIVEQNQYKDQLTHYLHTQARCAWTLLYAKRWDLAIEQCRRVLDKDRTHTLANHYLARIHMAMGKPEESLTYFAKAGMDGTPEDMRRNYNLFAERACALAQAGRTEEATNALAALQADLGEGSHVSHYRIAQLQSSLGNLDDALISLARARESFDLFVVWSAVDPNLDCLRVGRSSEFRAHLEAVGLGTAKF